MPANAGISQRSIQLKLSPHDLRIPELRFAPSGMTLQNNLMTLNQKSQISNEKTKPLLFGILSFEN